MIGLLDPNAGYRSEAEWRRLLSDLIASLSAFSGIQFEPTSWFVRDDQPGYASACNCVDVRGVVSPVFRLDACGVVCVTINFGEAAWVTCNLLLFSCGSRVRVSEGGDLMVLPYTNAGWSDPEWAPDLTGEWESHTSNMRWGEP